MPDSVETLPNERRVVITRVFDAPRDLVWRAWTEPKHVAQWFGPKIFTVPSCELDVRVGGAFRLTMRGPNGDDYPMQGVFREVVKPERLSYSNIAVDNDGNHLLEGVTTVTFEAVGGKTRIVIDAHAIGVSPLAPQMLAGMEAGWSQSLDKLAASLAAGSQ
jgi:uncharacterized protein YndB with AHSA1/START domain